jgi:hypothetical protein
MMSTQIDIVTNKMLGVAAEQKLQDPFLVCPTGLHNLNIVVETPLVYEVHWFLELYGGPLKSKRSDEVTLGGKGFIWRLEIDNGSNALRFVVYVVLGSYIRRM